MNVLVPIDIKGIYSGNPFKTELIRSLEIAGCTVDYGRFRLGYSYKKYDIVNFQWPEYIISNNPPKESDFEWLGQKLVELKKTSKIVCTIHNESPHRRKTNEYYQLYDMLYKNSDGFIHMGKKSYEVLCERHPRVRKKKHTVIPHGNYAIFGPKIDKEVAKDKYKLSQSITAIIVGAIRNEEEVDLVLKFAKELQVQKVKLIFAGKIMSGKTRPTNINNIKKRLREEFRIYKTKKLIDKCKSIAFMLDGVDHDEMASLLSASDILIIPRKDSLNSGNVPLGFTYGCVVVGPNIGVIGEILTANGNPVFEVDQIDETIPNAISSSRNLVSQKFGENNLSKARNEWCWEKIGAEHKMFYSKLLSDDLLPKNWSNLK